MRPAYMQIDKQMNSQMDMLVYAIEGKERKKDILTSSKAKIGPMN